MKNRLSLVEWFSSALAFRSLYYPWGKMGTTRSPAAARFSHIFINLDPNKRLDLVRNAEKSLFYAARKSVRAHDMRMCKLRSREQWVVRGPVRASNWICFSLQFLISRLSTTMFLYGARLFISIADMCGYVYTPEVYPTSMRGIGLGACSGAARIGCMITPFVAMVSRTMRW